MKYLVLLVFLAACGQQGTVTKVKEVCSGDSPAFTLPDQVVCNHAPSDMVEVSNAQGKLVYLCVKQ